MVKVDTQWDNQWKKLFLGIFSVMKWVNLSEEQKMSNSFLQCTIMNHETMSLMRSYYTITLNLHTVSQMIFKNNFVRVTTIAETFSKLISHKIWLIKKIPKFSHVNQSKKLRNFLAHCVEGFKMGSRTWMPELGETFERQSPLPTVRSELLCKRT